jgi:hypothetical protein
VRFRRKRLPPELLAPYEAFQAVLAELEPAKVAITDVLPGTRLPGRPLPNALDAFEQGVRSASGLMLGWRCPELEASWTACMDGLAEATRRAERLRRDDPGPAGFEGLLGKIQELLDPLEPFADAEDRFRSLRRKA